MVLYLVVAFFELSCFGADASRNSFTGETILYILFPLLLIAFTAVTTYYTTSRDQAKRSIALHDNRESHESSGGDSVKRVTPWESAKAAAFGVGTVALFLLQPTLVKQFSLLFSCTKMGADTNDIFLQENLEVRCYTTEHWTLALGLGLPLLGLYVFGIPFGIFKLLSKPENRAKAAKITEIEQIQSQTSLDDVDSLNAAAKARASMNEDMKSFESNYGFIFLGYKSDNYLWEIVVMARKGALSVCGVALGHEPRSQVNQITL